MANFKKAQQIVGLNEGGFQIDPRDQGNYFKGNLIGTNWGISAPLLASYLGRIPTREEMKALPKKTAEEILRQVYWMRNKLDQLKNQSVATLIYDGTVNQGTNTIRQLLERVIKQFDQYVPYYEVFTEKGIKVLNKLNQRALFYKIKDARRSKYKSHRNRTFIKGWLRRLERIRYFKSNSFSEIWPFAAMLGIGCGILIIIAL